MSNKYHLPLQKFFLVLCFGVLCTACAPIYVPNARNTPLFESKGEFQASGIVGLAYDIQTAYAISNHVGVIANGSMANNERAKRFQHRKHQFVEAGVGYFGKRNKLYFEVYAGYGIGRGMAKDSVYYVFDDDMLYSAETQYNRVFIQPAIGTKLPNFEWSLAARLSRVNYDKLDIFYQDDPVAVADRKYLYFEPSASIKIAMQEKKVFFVLQTGLNIPLYNESGNAFDVERFSGGAGLQFRILPKKSQ